MPRYNLNREISKFPTIEGVQKLEEEPLLLLKYLMNQGDGDRALAYGRLDTFDAAATHVAHRKNTWQNGFKYGGRARGQHAALRLSGDRSGPVLMKPFSV